MSIITVIIILLVLGVLAYLVQVKTPWLHGTIRTIIVWFLIICAVLIVLHAFGVIPLDWKVPRVR